MAKSSFSEYKAKFQVQLFTYIIHIDPLCWGVLSFLKMIFLCVWVLCLPECLCTVLILVLKEAREGTRSPWTGIADVVSHHVDSEIKSMSSG